MKAHIYIDSVFHAGNYVVFAYFPNFTRGDDFVCNPIQAVCIDWPQYRHPLELIQLIMADAARYSLDVDPEILIAMAERRSI